MATVRQRQQQQLQQQQAEEGSPKLSLCLKVLLVVGEAFAILGMIYVVFDWLVVNKTLMSFKYMNTTFDNQTSTHYFYSDNETIPCTDKHLEECMFTINPPTEGEMEAVSMYAGNIGKFKKGNVLPLSIYIIHSDNENDVPTNAVCGDSICVIKRSEDHPTVIVLTYFLLQISMSFARLFLEFDSILHEWKVKHEFDKVWCCKCCGEKCKKCQCTKHDCFKNIVPFLVSVPNTFLANALQNAGTRLYGEDKSSGVWTTQSDSLFDSFNMFYYLEIGLGIQLALVIFHIYFLGTIKKKCGGNNDGQKKQKRCCCVALFISCCKCCCKCLANCFKCIEGSVNMIVGTSLFIFLVAFTIFIMVTNMMAVGFSGMMFSSPLPVSVAGPEIATTFAIFNVIGRFVFYASLSIPYCARCAGMKTVSSVSGGSNATKAKLPRLSQVQRAESANEDMQAMEEQREKRQQRKKEKDKDENNQTDFVNPLIQQQQQSQPQQMLVTCPPHLKPGQAFKMKLTNGSQLRVVVPQGIRPGMNFSVALPR
jgi:hypothetical protein